VTGLPHDQPMKLTGELRKAIDGCFAYDNIESILKALDASAARGSVEVKTWAQKTKKTILERSPTSVKVTLKEMQLGKNWTIDHAFQREYHIASVFMEGHDFIEGVSARLIRKPAETPVWQPATLEDVPMDSVDRYFATRSQEQLQLYNRGPDASYLRYPHAWIGLPTEKDIQQFIEQGGKGRKDVLKHFVQTKEGKLGVKEKVLEILDRKTSVHDGSLVWDSSAENAHDANISRGSRDPKDARR
jgi:3-hydroxyisobutyryl-CoA hydrolase